MLKRTVYFMCVMVCIVILFSGCKHKKAAMMAPSSAMRGSATGTAGDMTEVKTGRMIVWKAQMTIQMKNVDEGSAKATQLVEQAGGYIEERTDQNGNAVNLHIRIPSDKFESTVNALKELGDVLENRTEGKDVTEEYIDVEARLNNKIALRDHLKQLLDKTTQVNDILAIETELNRVQTDIDSMQGRIKSLKTQVDFATIGLNLQQPAHVQKTILGPLGWLWWGVEKLFVIRE